MPESPIEGEAERRERTEAEISPSPAPALQIQGVEGECLFWSDTGRALRMLTNHLDVWGILGRSPGGCREGADRGDSRGWDGDPHTSPHSKRPVVRTGVCTTRGRTTNARGSLGESWAPKAQRNDT